MGSDLSRVGRSTPVRAGSYKLHRRPGHNQVVTNDGYQGLCVIDPRVGVEATVVPFTDNYDSSGVITEWCFKHDGSAVVVLNEESRTGSYLSLVGGRSYDVGVPFNPAVDICYTWGGDSFWVRPGRYSPLFRLSWNDGLPCFIESSGAEARRYETSWHRAMSLLPRRSVVSRVEPDFERLLYHDYGAHGHVGVIDWSQLSGERLRGPSWSAPFSGEAPQLAYAGEKMFILNDYEIIAVNKIGDVVSRYSADEGFDFSDLDVVFDQDGEGALLAALETSLGSPRRTRMWLLPVDRTEDAAER